jgi:serine/threonine protein kinase
MAEDVFGIVGTVVAGAYQVESVVAEGGFGVVYRAHHGGFGAPVALKLLKIPQQDPAQRSAFLELFRAEAELLFRLSASLPAVVRPLHVGALTTSDGRLVPYIVMEWLDGLTLEALIQQRVAAGQPPVALRKLVRLLTPVARALETAHNFGAPEGQIAVVHRDLKPEKIFIAQVAGEEVVKLLDLGIGNVRTAASQMAGPMSQDASVPGAFAPAYGAPEQWAPRHYGQTGPWTDVWGFALCIARTLAARTRIAGDPPAMMGIALDETRRPTPRQEGVGISDAVEAVFARALALDPRARQRNVGVFWDELTAALEVADAERALSPARAAYADEGVAAPRIELLELHSRPPLASVPRKKASSAALERVLLADLEFDPTSAPRSPSAEPHFVPDLELAPPSVSRQSSGVEHVAVTPSTVLDLDDAPLGVLASLDLDLPSDEPISIRPVSSPRVRAVPATAAQQSPIPPRTESGSMPAVRESRPPRSAAPAPSSSWSPELGLGTPASAPRPALPSPVSSAFPLDLRQYETRPLMRRLRPAFALLGAAILVAFFDPLYAAANGRTLDVLGLRPSVFGGALLLLALGLGAREALRTSDP